MKKHTIFNRLLPLLLIVGLALSGCEAGDWTDTAYLDNLGSTNLTATNLNAPTGRGATIIVAASDAPAHVKAQADYVATGNSTNPIDDVILNAAVANATGKKVYGIGTFYSYANPITLNTNNSALDLWTESSLTYNGTGHAIEAVSPNVTSNLNTVDIKVRVLAVGSATSAEAAVGLYLQNVNTSKLDWFIQDFQNGAATVWNTTAGQWSEENFSNYVSMRSSKHGLRLTGPGSFQRYNVGLFWWSPHQNFTSTRSYGIKDDSANHYSVSISTFAATTDTIGNSTGIECLSPSWSVGTFIWDNNTVASAGSISVNSSVDLNIRQIDTAEGSDTFWRDARYLLSNIRETLEGTFGGNTQLIPTVSGWSSSVNGSGAVGSYLSYFSVGTGGSANTSATNAVQLYNLNANGSPWSQIGYDQFMLFSAKINRYDVSPDIASYPIIQIQLKNPSSYGELADKGIGIRIENLALLGTSYNSTLGSVNLTASLNAQAEAEVSWLLDPTLNHIYWYLNGTYLGGQTTAANVPVGQGTTANLVVSIHNSNAIGANFYIGAIRLWRE